MSRPLPSFDLVARETAPPPAHENAPRLEKHQSWLAVALPNLPLDALPGSATTDPAVAVEALHGQVYVVAANRQARRYGIAPGCKLNAALALAASLQVFERSLGRERASLESLAA